MRRKLVLVLVTLTGLMLLSDDAAAGSPTRTLRVVPEKKTVSVVGRSGARTTLRGRVVWSARQLYRLEGEVETAPGATLVIEAGTRVEGAPGSRLVITRDSWILAKGTPYQPVVMSCAASTKSPGCWGGVVIQGNAPINFGTPTSPPARDVGGSGCNEADAVGLTKRFGGCDAADSTGVMRYMRIEFAQDG